MRSSEADNTLFTYGNDGLLYRLDEQEDYDDIRFVPIDGSMISYVYDARNNRLLAQLDERNYATFYEYNEEGKLMRIKKETEKGIMTIQENREKLKINE